MAGKLQKEIRQNIPFRSAEAEAVVSMVRTADALTRGLDHLLKTSGLTTTQYNVLRILRGAGKDGATCSEIGARMVKEDPDVTRLLDRMEKRGLIARERDRQDRRVVVTAITPAGLKLVNRLDDPVDELHRRHLKGLSRARIAALIEDLERIRANTQS